MPGRSDTIWCMRTTGFRHVRTLIVLAASLAFARGAETPASVVEGGVAAVLRDAHMLATRHDGAQVLRVSGQSMLPFFGDGAVLVMKPISAAELRPGMVVVYENRFGETVAHRVLSAIEGGWRVHGYNNDRADSTRVDQSNLRGVVYAIFHPRRSQGLVTDETTVNLVRSTASVLAAPAR